MTDDLKYDIIKSTSCKLIGVRTEFIEKQYRNPKVVKARHIIMYVCSRNQMTQFIIADLIKRERSTVSSGVANVENYVKLYDEDRELVWDIMAEVNDILNKTEK